MAISKQEWRDIEERAAAAKRGERRAGWHWFKKFGAVPTAIAAGLAGAGLFAWWLTHLAVQAVHAAGPRSISIGVILWVVATIVLTAVLYRPRIIPVSMAVSLLRLAVVGAAWIFLIGYLSSTVL